MEQPTLETAKFFGILHTIFSTLNIDEILTRVVTEVQSILKADRCTLYLVDRDRKELYSKVLQAESLMEIRVPFNRSLNEGLRKSAAECIDACPTAAISWRNKENSE